MPWLPISDSGFPFGFGSLNGAVMIGSVVSGTSIAVPEFDLSMTGIPVTNFRITNLNYLAVGTIGTPAQFTWVDGGDSQERPNTNGNNSFTPSPFLAESAPETGDSSISYMGASGVTETFAFLFEVWIDETPTTLKGAGRTFTGYVSAYSAKQTQPRRVQRFQRRRLVADFNGAIQPPRRIVSATWECTSPWATYMQDALIPTDQRSATVDVSFNFSGWGWIKCTATLDDGTTLNYEFCFTVVDGPMYPNSVYLNNSGPFSLTVIV